MKTRQFVFGFLAALLAAGIWWSTKAAPSNEKPVVSTDTAKSAEAPSTKVAAPAIAAKVAVEAPKAPVAVPSANPQPTTTAQGVDPELTTAINDFLAVLDTQDVNTLVRNYLVPSALDSAMKDANTRYANVSPEIKAQMDQMMQQKMPQLIDQMTTQMTQQMTQNPKTMQSFQKLATALRLAQSAPPTMNATGDQATYTLNNNGDKDVPSSVVMVKHDGKWTIDFDAMMQNARSAP